MFIYYSIQFLAGIIGMLVYALVKIKRLDDEKEDDTISEVIQQYGRRDWAVLTITFLLIPVWMSIIKAILKMGSNGNIPFVADQYEYIIEYGTFAIMFLLTYNGNSILMAIQGSLSEKYFKKKKKPTN